MKKAIILGGGVTGCVSARELGKKGYRVTLIEKKPYLGGGCHTFFMGGHPYTEGPRFLTITDEKIFDYIDEIVPLRRFALYEDTYIEQDRAFYSYPMHWDDIQVMPDFAKIKSELDNRPENIRSDNFEDSWINAVGPTLYGKYVKNYTEKMWKVKSNRELDGYEWSVKGFTIQHGERNVTDLGTDKHAHPFEKEGFNRFFEACVADADVRLNTEVKHVDLEQKKVYLGDEEITGDIMISTLPLEELMENTYGSLRYIGRDFYPIVLPIEHLFKDGHHFLYYPNGEKHTRIVEYKNLTMHEAPDTLIVVEVPSMNGKLYPCEMMTEERKKADLYKKALPNNVFSIGRLGTYQYTGIAQCIEQVWDLVKGL